MYNYLVYLRFLSPFSLLSEQLCQLSVYLHYSLCRHRKSDDEEMSGGARCCFGFLTFLAQILLHGVVGLVLFWVIAYHSKDNVGPFSFRTDPELEWNLHPVLMILGFIYFMGQGENFILLQSKPADPILISRHAFSMSRTLKTLSMQNPKLQKNALPPFKASLEHLYQYFGGVNTEFAKRL